MDERARRAISDRFRRLYQTGSQTRVNNPGEHAPELGLGFGLDLIAAEEARTVVDVGAVERVHTRVFEQRETTARQVMVVLDDDDRGIPGPGRLNSFVVKTRSPDYRVRVESEATRLVDSSFRDLETHSVEFAHVAAYETTIDGASEFVVAVNEVAFREFLTIVAEAEEAIEFVRVRGEVDLVV